MTHERTHGYADGYQPSAVEMVVYGSECLMTMRKHVRRCACGDAAHTQTYYTWSCNHGRHAMDADGYARADDAHWAMLSH